jgi:hypothetical protein
MIVFNTFKVLSDIAKLTVLLLVINNLNLSLK